MASKDKAEVSLPVSPWDAILKAAKEQLPSLDSDSSLVSKSFLLGVNCSAWARTALGTPLFRPHFDLWGLFSLTSPWGSGYPLPSGFVLGFPELLRMDIGAVDPPGHPCSGPDPAAGLNAKTPGLPTLLLGQGGAAPTSDSNNLAKTT